MAGEGAQLHAGPHARLLHVHDHPRRSNRASPIAAENARAVVSGAPGDLCLLDAPLADVTADPSAERARARIIVDAVVHGG